MSTSDTPHQGSYGGADVERLVDEPSKPGGAARTAFQRDRARVLHSSALRRLAGKTQVVGVGVDDFPRTRLTHSLECAQIGRELAGRLGADPDLVDAACLAHDLGHPPFGHTGEEALDVAAADCGGFEGNAQSLRVLTRLEVKALHADGTPAGLNLTRAVLDATAKYPWALADAPDGSRKHGAYVDDLPVFDWLRAGAEPRQRCLEATVMDWADDVAYSVHDVEDGVVAGQVDPQRLVWDDELRGEVIALTAAQYSSASPADLEVVLDELVAHEWWPASFDGSVRTLAGLKRATSALIGRFCAAAHDATRAAHGSGPLIRHEAALVVPASTRAECALLKGVTAVLVMRRAGALERQAGERALLTRLVEAVDASAPESLSPALRPSWDHAADAAGRRRVVVDQVASLTDTSAQEWHDRLVGPVHS